MNTEAFYVLACVYRVLFVCAYVCARIWLSQFCEPTHRWRTLASPIQANRSAWPRHMCVVACRSFVCLSFCSSFGLIVGQSLARVGALPSLDFFCFCFFVVIVVVIVVACTSADGKVYKALDLDDPSRKPVAMKKVRRDTRRGYSVTVMREISLLMRLKHANIVTLYEVCTYGNDGLFLVMCAMDTDLLSLYYSKVNGRRCVLEPYAKWFFRQLLTALAFCHEHNVVHRDVKSSNVKALMRDAIFCFVDFDLISRLSTTDFRQHARRTSIGESKNLFFFLFDIKNRRNVDTTHTTRTTRTHRATLA